MPTMTVYDFGSVVLISFPFTSLDASKKRPAVVVSRRSYQEATHDIVLARRSRVKCMTNRGIC
jgi:mRNA interferase MazF